MFPNFFEPVYKFEFFVLMNGKKGKGKRMETQAVSPETAAIRGELAAAHKFGIPVGSFEIKNVTKVVEIEA